MEKAVILLIPLCLLLPGCLDSVNDTVNPERELFDDNTFVNEDQHIKLTWSVDSVATIRMEFEKQEGPNLDFYTMTEINYEKYEQCAEGEDESFVYFADLSAPNSGGASLQANVDAGTYVTVIDNTDCPEAQPPDQGGLFSSDEDDEARVDYRITAQ
ncbi:MAG: hypothetical protein CMB61_06365 [Euryarchaeota archaeon]|nr:hypothetical protein [Euryarchaeota archaeon]|tara:strand:- start:767 stop:1237 length:471 start_codon:yes stop_codon:yes gene_type:complete